MHTQHSHLSMCTCRHAHMHTYMHTHTLTHMNTQVHTHLDAHAHSYTDACTCLYIHTRVHTHMLTGSDLLHMNTSSGLGGLPCPWTSLCVSCCVTRDRADSPSPLSQAPQPHFQGAFVHPACCNLRTITFTAVRVLITAQKRNKRKSHTLNAHALMCQHLTWIRAPCD